MNEPIVPESIFNGGVPLPDPLTIRQLHEALGKLVDKWGHINITMMSAPEYEEANVTSALFAPDNGTLFLLCNVPPEDLEDDDRIEEFVDDDGEVSDIIDAVYTVLPPAPHEEFDIDVAESA